jgi:hypothetical protein
LHFRVYKLNPGGRIMSGDWIEAATEREARLKAHALCDRGAPTVELWRGAQRLAVLARDDPKP